MSEIYLKDVCNKRGPQATKQSHPVLCCLRQSMTMPRMKGHSHQGGAEDEYAVRFPEQFHLEADSEYAINVNAVIAGLAAGHAEGQL